MSLLKVKSNIKSVLFIESMGATIRPYKTPSDLIVVDEEKAKNDMQLVKCVLDGSISISTLDGKDWEYVKKEPQPKKVSESKKDEVVEKTAKGKPGRKKKAQPVHPETQISSQEKNRVAPEFDVEPKNSRPVVMAGKVPCRKSMQSESDTGVPDFVPQNQISNEREPDDLDPENGDIQPGDIR